MLMATITMSLLAKKCYVGVNIDKRTDERTLRSHPSSVVLLEPRDTSTLGYMSC